ncbi:glycosyltransferase [Ferrimonas sp. SCSIO 43195]|uniref:glycosyltransferase family 2 protein n=1 Tax=Ferrimonas sp. SCSIO 43195 TaxID=2822844 RepID=UPI002075E23F|nr:glycosyltransferase [Ferrimonas sp. SCSIO 43195]USD38672.1 glycosyltransferase [Ferrimonas sp. SCSIO 43195]
MVNQPLVSVLIPVFNCESFIEEAVLSVLNQSYSNVEILVCDDGSVDDSYQILKSLSQQNSRITLYKNSENLGKVETIRNLISISNGDFIAFLDSDDSWEVEKLKIQVDFLASNDDYVFISTSCNRIDESGRVIGFDLIESSNDDIVDSILNGNGMSVCCSSTLVRTDAAKSIGGFNPYFHDCNGEDLDFIARLLSVGKGVSIKDNLYNYRFRSGSLTRRVFFTVRQRHSHQIIAFLFSQRLLNEGRDSINSDLPGLEDKIRELSIPYERDRGLMSRKVAIDYAIIGEYKNSLKYLINGLDINRIGSCIKTTVMVSIIITFPRSFLLKLKNFFGMTGMSSKV